MQPEQVAQALLGHILNAPKDRESTGLLGSLGGGCKEEQGEGGRREEERKKGGMRKNPNNFSRLESGLFHAVIT